MTTDRKLLEDAARAAGIPILAEGWIPRPDEPDCDWNPLLDDGDAFRLAVRLEIPVGFYGGCVSTGFEQTSHNSADMIQEWYGDQKGDVYAATRRCIVRAAAAMGRKE